MMPEIDGPAFYERVREIDSSICEHMLFISGGAVTPRARAFVDQREVRVLDKPVPRDALLAAIQQSAR
jgi:CheY-like chemotaxis protein